MPLADVFENPWMRFVPANATPQLEAYIKHMWQSGARPTKKGWVSQKTGKLVGSLKPAATQPYVVTAGDFYHPASTKKTTKKTTKTTKTPQPVAATPAPATPAPAAQADLSPLITGDYEYLQRQPGIDAKRRNLYLGYGNAAGYDVDPTTPGIQQDPELMRLAAENPSSIIAGLRRMGEKNVADIWNSANARGVLFSGAAAQAQQNEGAAAIQRAAEKRQDLEGQLIGLTGEEQDLRWDVYNRLAANPPGIGAPAAQPNPAVPVAGAAVPGLTRAARKAGMVTPLTPGGRSATTAPTPQRAFAKPAKTKAKPAPGMVAPLIPGGRSGYVPATKKRR